MLRSLFGLALLAGAVGLGWFARTRSRPSGPSVQPGELAQAASRVVGEALERTQQALRVRVKEAASLEPLRAALSNRVDAPTLVDLFATEDWWRPFREQVAVSRLAVGDVVATHGTLEIGERDRDVMTAARETGISSAIIAVAGKPVIIAAARIQAAEGAPVVLLGKPLETSALTAIAAEERLSFMLSDTRGVVAMAASDAHRALLEGLAQRLPADSVVAEPDTGWAAARAPLSRDLFVWTLRDVPVAAAAPTARYAFWGGAGLLALVGLALLLVPRKAPAPTSAPKPVTHEITLPFGTQERAAGAGAVRSALRPAPEVAAAPAVAPAPGMVEAPPPVVMVQPPQGASPGPTPQQLFGRYKVIERLGVGGMSEVFTAVAYGAEGFSRTFVIKRLRPELARSKEAVAQFVDEARVQASLVHSNIVPVFDFGVLGDEYFMIEEYILGRDLSRITTRCVEKTSFCLEPRLVYYIAHETLQALAYAHSKLGKDGQPMGIVHRDVSVTNILLSLAGEVKLFDFGIAKTNQRNTQTQAGMVKGNANFMSPEQARGQPVDGRSDLFSLGVVIYYCLSGRMLYPGDNDLDILYRAATGPGPEEWAAIDRLKPPASTILRKALAVDPAERFQSAEEFAAVLAPHAGGMKGDAASLMELLFGDELRREAA